MEEFRVDVRIADGPARADAPRCSSSASTLIGAHHALRAADNRHLRGEPVRNWSSACHY